MLYYFYARTSIRIRADPQRRPQDCLTRYINISTKTVIEIEYYPIPVVRAY